MSNSINSIYETDLAAETMKPAAQQIPGPEKKPLFEPEIDPEAPDENPGINPATNPERFDDEPDPLLEPEIGDDPDEEKKKLPRF